MLGIQAVENSESYPMRPRRLRVNLFTPLPSRLDFHAIVSTANLVHPFYRLKKRLCTATTSYEHASDPYTHSSQESVSRGRRATG